MNIISRQSAKIKNTEKFGSSFKIKIDEKRMKIYISTWKGTELWIITNVI